MGLTNFIGLTSLLFATNAFAGNWSSGGGELIKDAHNPWFLENTKRVTYCVAVDEKNVSAPKQKIESIVRLAIDYWITDFRKAATIERYYDDTMLPLKLATQVFFQVSCDRNPDLRFQFGLLDDEQFRYLGSPKKYIGIAVRTDYDPIRLKGKGFIYISPDNGPLKYEDSQEFVENSWSYDGLLHKTIVHELGHVFGLQHTNRSREVMSTQYLEQILNKDSAPSYRSIESLSSHLNIRLPDDRIAQYCSFENVDLTAKRFFGAPPLHNCLLVNFKENRLRAYSAQDVPERTTDFKWDLLGTAEIEKRHFSDNMIVTNIVLNKQQKVFNVPFTAEWKTLPAVFQRFEVLRGTYINQSTKMAHRVAIRSSVYSHLSIAGMLGEEIFIDLPYETDFIKKK